MLGGDIIPYLFVRSKQRDACRWNGDCKHTRHGRIGLLYSADHLYREMIYVYSPCLHSIHLKGKNGSGIE